MRRFLILSIAAVVVSTAWTEASSPPTNPKILAVKRSDLPKNFKAGGAAYCAKKTISKQAIRHGLVNCYDESFQKTGNNTSGALAVDDATASFQAPSGAGWSLHYLTGRIESSLKQYKFSSLKAPKFGDESFAVRISGTSSGYHYSGPILAFRVKRYDEVILELGLAGKFKAADAYPLAGRAVKELRRGR